MRTMSRLPLLLGAVLVACGAASFLPEARQPGTGEPALKMRHQILFTGGDDVQVFEGYMVLAKDAFIVRAFAGPGVNLFTVVRSGERRRATLHIAALANRIDIEKVGDDIARVYLPGCEASSVAGDHRHASERSVRHCLFFGEPLTEVIDERNRPLSRKFPEAHGIGLEVTYDDYEPVGNEVLPRQITLTWGGTSNRMVIRVVEAEPVDEFPRDTVEDMLGQESKRGP
jgi:hypothetical protein